jgi:hypothetical protein
LLAHQFPLALHHLLSQAVEPAALPPLALHLSQAVEHPLGLGRRLPALHHLLSQAVEPAALPRRSLPALHHLLSQAVEHPLGLGKSLTGRQVVASATIGGVAVQPAAIIVIITVVLIITASAQ